jgi:hypothetical protein
VGVALLLAVLHFTVTIMVAFAWWCGEIGSLAYREGAASPEVIDRAAKIQAILLSVLHVLAFPLATEARPASWYLVVSNSLLCGASMAALLAALCAIMRRFKRNIGPACCSMCNYDLTGNVSGVCPECGSDATARAAKKPGAPAVQLPVEARYNAHELLLLAGVRSVSNM